jgi:hypothetical protein
VSDDDGSQRDSLSQLARALADDLSRCADLIDGGANLNPFRVIAFQLSRAALHVGNAVQAVERGLDRFATVEAAAEHDGVT